MDAVYRLSYAILGNEADARDAAQETFVAAWRQLPRLRDVDRFDAWFQRVAVNAARMTLRSRGRRRVREIPVMQVAGLAETAIAPTDADRLDAALRRLPLEQRAILALHHLDGQPLVELAEILAIPVGTVKSRLHTARQALQRTLADQELDR
jgi:RNA polymerase sigma-70 factor (ECF subfamily)